MQAPLSSRSLGNSGLRCSILGLGTGRLQSASSGISRAEAIHFILRAAAGGVNFIDTADSYGQGDSEIAIGHAIRGQREKFIIATKAGFRFSSVAGSLINVAKPLFRGVIRRFAAAGRAISQARNSAPKMNVLQQDFAPAAVDAAIEASLRRLGTDYVDIFFLHEPTLEAVRDLQLWEMLLRLKADGKLRCLGVSSNDPNILEATIGLSGIDAIQTAVNPTRPAAIWPLLEKFASLGIGVVANQVFEGGQLLIADSEVDRVACRKQLITQAEALSLTPRQLLFAFALGAPGVTCALSGATHISHLDENLADLRVLASRATLDWGMLRRSLQTEP